MYVLKSKDVEILKFMPSSKSWKVRIVDDRRMPYGFKSVEQYIISRCSGTDIEEAVASSWLTSSLDTYWVATDQISKWEDAKEVREKAFPDYLKYFYESGTNQKTIEAAQQIGKHWGLNVPQQYNLQMADKFSYTKGLAHVQDRDPREYVFSYLIGNILYSPIKGYWMYNSETMRFGGVAPLFDLGQSFNPIHMKLFSQTVGLHETNMRDTCRRLILKYGIVLPKELPNEFPHAAEVNNILRDIRTNIAR